TRPGNPGKVAPEESFRRSRLSRGRSRWGTTDNALPHRDDRCGTRTQTRKERHVQDSRLSKDRRQSEASVDTQAPQRRSGRWDDLNRQLKATYEAYGAGEIPPRLIELMARFDKAQSERRPVAAGR